MSDDKKIILAIAVYATIALLTFGRAYSEPNPYPDALIPRMANGYRIIGSTLFWPFYWSIELAQRTGAHR